jgi:hypothetical protein
MSSQNLVIANFKTGYENDREPFLVDNDAFPVIVNANIFRGKVRKKRGTSLLGRLQRALTNQSLGNTSGAGAFSGNILSLLSLNSSPATNASIVLGSATITVGADVFTDTATPTGVLTGSTGGSGTINYQTGALTLTGAPITTAVTITFKYYPNIPVMGLEEFDVNTVNFPTLVAFDQTYAYEYTQSNGPFYDVSFYQYTESPVTWSGANFQQFWTTSYQSAMWATNAKPGFHFKNISAITTANPTVITTATAHGLSNNDRVFLNEISGTAGTLLNGLTFQVTVTGANTFTVPPDTSALAYVSGGIIQYLTRLAPGVSGDGIRFYSGDPTAGTAGTNQGWVNFSPPLSNLGLTGGNPQYLVGAKIIIPFKGRLLFFGTYTQTSTGSSVYNANQLVYSLDGTAYYSVTPEVSSGTPTQVANAGAYYSNVVGFGGFINAPINQEIVTVAENEDVLICGYETQPLKLIFTGNAALPFIYQSISSELGSQSTFSSIAMDVGVLNIGPYGLTVTTQTQAARIDLQIPDWVFNIAQANNGAQRVSAIRNFRQECVFFSFTPEDRVYDPNSSPTVGNLFPSQTLVYNYREKNYALYDENYTTYGTFRRTSGLTWADLGAKYGTWANWLDPWNSSAYAGQYPEIIAGNQHGFVMVKKEEGTDEATSQLITAIATSGTEVLITSPNHCLNDGDFIGIRSIIGNATMTQFNNSVKKVTVISADSFTVRSFYDSTGNQITITGTYLGGGVYIRYTNINIQTKQFPLSWGEASQWRMGTQRFLMESTSNGQITVDVLTNQNADTPVNDPATNPWLVYGNTMVTYPENIFYDPLYNPIRPQQAQSWHRLSNSFEGSTVQLGFRMSDTQMLNTGINQSEIIIHAIVLELNPGAILI